MLSSTKSRICRAINTKVMTPNDNGVCKGGRFAPAVFKRGNLTLRRRLS